jgi:hypothetical protein
MDLEEKYLEGIEEEGDGVGGDDNEQRWVWPIDIPEEPANFDRYSRRQCL